MPIYPDGWEDIDDDDGWEDYAPTPEPAKPSFGLSGSSIQAEPSWWEKTKGAGAGFGKKLASLALRGGAYMAAPDLGLDVARERRVREIEDSLGIGDPRDGEKLRPAERTGRMIGAAAPQVAAALATAGSSIPFQAAVAGGLGYLQSRAEGADPVKSAASGALSGGFTLAGGALSRLASPGKGAVRSDVLAAAKRLGIPEDQIPASVKTQSELVRYLEGAASKLPGGGKILERADAARAALAGAGDETLTGMGGAQAAKGVRAGSNISDEVGKLKGYEERAAQIKAAMQTDAQKAAEKAEAEALARLDLAARAKPASGAVASGRKRAYEDFQTVKNALYDKADISPYSAEAKKLTEFAQKTLEKGGLDPQDEAAMRYVLGRVSPSKKIVEAVGAYGEKVPSQVDVPAKAEELRSMIKWLSGRAGWQRGGGEEVVFKSPALKRKMAALLDDDLYESLAATGTDVGNKLRQAQEFYSKGIKLHDSDVARSISRLAAKGKTSQIAGALFKPGMAAEDIGRVLQLAGPDAKPAISASVMESIVKPAMKGGRVDPAALTKNMAKWGDKLDALLSPDELDELARLAKPQEVRLPDISGIEPPSAARAIGERGQRFVEANTGKPSQIVEGMVRPGMATEDISRVMSMAGDAGEEVSASVWNRILSAAKNKDGQITPAGIAKQIGAGPGKWKPDQLKMILGDDRFRRLMDMQTVAGAFDQMNRITRGSPTAGLLAPGLTAGGSFLSGDNSGDALRRAAIMYGLQYGVGRGLGSGPGQAWLTTGFPRFGAAVGTGTGMAGRAATAAAPKWRKPEE